MQHQNPAHDPNHASHDVVLIAGHAAGDLTDSERARAQSLLASCQECGQLRRDILGIASATRALPNLASAPRDFRLQPQQAARLRRGGFLRSILAPFGGARSATRPMAAAFTSLGVAGLLVGAMLPGMLGGAAAGPAGREQTLGAAAAPSQVPAAPPGSEVGGPVSSAGEDNEYGVKDGSPRATDSVAVLQGAGDGDGEDAGAGETPGRTTFVAPPSPIIVGSLALLAVGLSLFALRFAGRRLR